MFKKLVIIEIVVCSLLLASIFTVSAADQVITVEDEIGDVIDGNYNKRPDIKDVDINKVVFTKTGKNVLIEIYLEEALVKTSDVEISFIFGLYTTDYEYAIYQFGDEIFGISEQGELAVTFSGFGNNIFSLGFMLIDTDEEYQEMTLILSKSTEEDEYMDSVPDMIITVSAGGPYTGKVGQSIKFSGTATGGDGDYSWEWYSNDESEPFGAVRNPSHKFTNEGTYEITVFVEDSSGSFGYANTTVVISGFLNGDSGLDGSGGGSGLIIFIILIVVIVVIAAVALIYIKKR